MLRVNSECTAVISILSLGTRVWPRTPLSKNTTSHVPTWSEHASMHLWGPITRLITPRSLYHAPPKINHRETHYHSKLKSCRRESYASISILERIRETSDRFFGKKQIKRKGRVIIRYSSMDKFNPILIQIIIT